MKVQSGIFAVAVCLAVACGLAAAQAPEEAPKPGPEHQKLAFFVGNWTGEGEMKPNPFTPGGKFKTTESCEWFEGGFAIVCHTEGVGPQGPMKGLGIMSYSIEEQAYTYYALDSGPMTMASVPHGTVEGNTWTYTDESMVEGQIIKSRFTMKETSPTSYEFWWDMLQEDGSWSKIMEGSAKKSP
jgi:hypothetical protein